MSPTPQEHASNKQDGAIPAETNFERVVVSGMSGLYPQARNIKEFSEILYNKVNPVTNSDKRWQSNHPEVSDYMGRVSDLDRFDAQFFKVHHRQATKMDPMSRKLLELAYEAIYDAGLNPGDFNEKKVGVFIAASVSETENICYFDHKTKEGFGITGCSKTMFANRISYWLNAKGPSVTVDSACCGSSVALEEALLALYRGDCEAALVGGSNICLFPQTMVNYNRCITIAADGKTKSFSEDADGCAKSEAINMLFLQKARNALRIYGEVISVKNEFISKMGGETGQVFGFNRDIDSYNTFLKQFYEHVNVAPEAVEYVEAFGSASPEADKTELQVIENVFCGNRTDPLFVGSVISNVGFTDAASGFTAMTKVLLGYHKGEIACNLHCERPRQDITALRDGRMQIVREHQPIRSTYTAVNGLSITGTNSHVLLHGHLKSKDYSQYKSTIPRLVTLSSREEPTLPKIFNDLKSRPVDPEELALLHNIHANNITGHLGRGYIILDTDNEQKTISLGEKSEYNNDARRPLWFVYSGMGSQWSGMGAQLMRIPIFAAAIERCRKVLEPRGIDIIHIITSNDKTIFDNVQNSFLGIAAIQIGLTDILKALGLTPDGIIGHSVGEMGCAYADGGLTTEEIIISAFCRGRVSLESQFIHGAMAAVGLGNEKMSKMCPPEIEVACHNGPESCTISGPADKIKEFVAKLVANGIFAKEVPCSNIAYHSRYIASAGPILLKYLSEVIKNPKPRSEKWLSTSVPQDKWNDPSVNLCSAEYLTNNLLNPVLFEETCRLIPSNAVLVEIAPHGLLQAILKRSLPIECKNMSLTKRGHADNTVFLLNTIGQLYIEGYQPKIQVLYPKVNFPVSTGTPHLSHHVEWMHNEEWFLSTFVTSIKKAASCNFLINTHEDEHNYLKGNVVRGKVLYPFAASLVAVWDTLAMTLGAKKRDVSVQFREVHLYSQPILHDQRQLKLNISLHRGNGRFDVMDENSKVASGFISTIDLEISSDFTDKSDQRLNIDSIEVYQNLYSRGYEYRDEFKSIYKVNETLTQAELLWNDNWVVLIDGILQLNTLKQTYSGVAQPSQIRDLTINVNKHYGSFKLSNGLKVIETKIDHIIDKTTCGGIVLSNIKFSNMAIETPDKITLELMDKPIANKKPVGKSEALRDEKHLVLEIGRIGDINTLQWEEATSGNGIKVKVHYAGLNVADVKRANGIIPFEDDVKHFGMDFSGLTENGDRVMGLVKNGAMTTSVTVNPDLLWPVPSHWSFEDAATVPLAYAQAFYCLNIKNKLERNSKVLIHGGTGALGQAAISIALAMGCQVFTTVADQSKKRFLQKLFPQLPAENIGNSRNSTFTDSVLNATNSEGCDIVLNCLKGELRNECLKCTAHAGTTVDTSLLQSRDDFVYGMSYMTKCRSFMAVDFNSIFESKNPADTKYLQRLVSEGIARGYVRPLSRVSYAPEEAPRAFRLLAASRHRGRVLIRLREHQPSAQLSRTSYTTNLCHVIFCDDHSAGLQLADMLIARGSTNLRIHCFVPSSHLNLKTRFWKNLGVKVVLTFGPTLTYEETLEMIDGSNDLEQVEGIYVMVMDKSSNVKKMTSIVNQIDRAARVSCPLLKYFAIANIDNNIGQEICAARSVDGLSATSISIPDLLSVNKNLNLTISDFTWYRIVVNAIERALQSDHPVLIAKPQLTPQLSLLQQLGNIAGIGDLFSCDDNKTLKDLGVENEQLNSIKSYLHNTYNITLKTEDILELSKTKIQQIEQSALGKDFKDSKDVHGLNTFFSYVDPDELRGTTELVLMDTLVNTSVGNELDVNKTYLCIVPGMEGHHERFRSMCVSLKLPAVVLQLGLDYLTETPKELAQSCYKVLLNKLGMKDTFYILGYEYGVAVALELAAILETRGKTGTIFCLGDAPDSIRQQVEEQLADFSTEEALQNGIITHMFSLMSADTTLVESALKSCSSWEERVRACVSILLGQVSHSAQYLQAVLEAAYTRLNAARKYHLNPFKLRSKIVLLRTKAKTSTEGVTLQQFSEQPIVEYKLAAPLAHATKDLQCASIINRYMSEDLMKFYDDSNLCISYFED